MLHAAMSKEIPRSCSITGRPLSQVFWCYHASSIKGLCNVQHVNPVWSADFQALLSPRDSEPDRCTCIAEHDARHRLST